LTVFPTVAARGVGSLIGLGCWLVANQPVSLADASPIKEAERVAVESEQRRRRAICWSGIKYVVKYLLCGVGSLVL